MMGKRKPSFDEVRRFSRPQATKIPQTTAVLVSVRALPGSPVAVINDGVSALQKIYAHIAD